MQNMSKINSIPYIYAYHSICIQDTFRGGSNSIAKYCKISKVLQWLLQYFEILQ